MSVVKVTTQPIQTPFYVSIRIVATLFSATLKHRTINHQKTIIMKTRIKAHPIGYIPIKAKIRGDHYGESVKEKQTVRMSNGQTRCIVHYHQLALGGARV